MDVVLLTLTTLSLAAAAGCGFLSWRVSREQRAREEARIATLASAMTPSSPRRPADEAFPSELEASADRTAIGDDRDAIGSVFNRATEGLRGRPTIKAGVIGAMALTIAIGAIIGARVSDSAAAPATARPAVSATHAGVPLELVSMRHQREGTTLTVSGLVRNPAKGVAVDDLTAVIFAFDRNGAFIASGRSPLDFRALGPGDESPFVVHVANVSDVARYRVTFRSATGLVRHIDRRGGQGQLAQGVR